MKTKYFLITLLLGGLCLTHLKSSAQNYDLINYNLNGTPTHGIKIKTHIPFQNGGSMPTLRIEGYNYGAAKPIGLNLVWYVYNNGFVHVAVSSWGGYTPPIYLCNESGLISIFIDDRSYFTRFHVYAYAKGMAADNATNFSGWTVADEAKGGTNQLLMPYVNQFSGKVVVDGNVLIGKTSQTNASYKLDVNGNIRANKVVVNTSGADYVFDPAYYLISIDSLNNYIQENHHLPGLPSAKKMQKEGMDVGMAYTKLVEKMEEMTKYLIMQQHIIDGQQKEIDKLKNAF